MDHHSYYQRLLITATWSRFFLSNWAWNTKHSEMWGPMRLIRRHPLCPNAKTVATLKHHRKARLFFQSFGKCIRVIGQRKFKDNCTICILCFGVEFKPVRNDIGSIFLCCVPPKRCSYSRIYSALAARVPVYDARQTAPMIRAHSPMFKMQRPCPIHTDTLNNTPRGIHVYLINLCGL